MELSSIFLPSNATSTVSLSTGRKVGFDWPDNEACWEGGLFSRDYHLIRWRALWTVITLACTLGLVEVLRAEQAVRTREIVIILGLAAGRFIG